MCVYILGLDVLYVCTRKSISKHEEPCPALHIVIHCNDNNTFPSTPVGAFLAKDLPFGGGSKEINHLQQRERLQPARCDAATRMAPRLSTPCREMHRHANGTLTRNMSHSVRLSWDTEAKRFWEMLSGGHAAWH